MTTSRDGFDGQLRSWLVADAPSTQPPALHGAIVDAARRSRQRPGWLVWLRGGVLRTPVRRVGRAGLATGYLLVVLALVAGLLVAAVMGARLLQTPPVPLGGNGRIAFGLSDLPGRPYMTVHVMQADGSDERSVANGIGQVYAMDGQALAWWDGPEPEVLTIADPAGDVARAVPGIRATRPLALSPDGSHIAWLKHVGERITTLPSGESVSEGQINELWVSPTSGDPGIRVVAAESSPHETFSGPTWSPDGSQIAFAGDTGVVYDVGGGSGGWGYHTSIWNVRADGTGLRRLSAHPAWDDFSMSWSPDGHHIAFDGFADATPLPSFGHVAMDPAFYEQGSDIFVVDVDTGAERLLVGGVDGGSSPEWSPDGSHIAWLTVDPEIERQQITVIGVHGGAPVGAPVRGPHTRAEFEWSPDGELIVFTWHEGANRGASDRLVDETIQTVRADFQEPPTVIRSVDHVADGLTWQRVDPPTGQP